LIRKALATGCAALTAPSAGQVVSSGLRMSRACAPRRPPAWPAGT